MRIFISYRTNAQPDRTLCDQLSKAFQAKGYSVFVDRQLEVGSRWADEIERAIEQCDILILLLSEESSHSEMVLAEVEKCRSVAARRGGSPRLLPVRVAFKGKLPYPLSSYIDPLQHVLWEGHQDTEAVTLALVRVMEGEVAGPASRPSRIVADGPSLPRPAAFASSDVLTSPGGALDVEDPIYVTRDCDEEALRVLGRGAGQTITIKGPRQVGKSSLLMRALSASIRAQRRVAFVDFQLLAAATGQESDLFKGFLREVLSQLELSPLAENDWDASATAAQSCTELFDRLVLRVLQGPLTLACDESDLILSLSFRDNFFGMLRAWHSKRAHPILRKRWGQLDLILVTSTEPYLFIARADQSPFNVGTVLALQDFNREQVDRLNSAHGSPLSAGEVEELLNLTGGHPYLVRRALYAVAGKGQGIPWRELLRSAAEEGGPFGDHLRRHLLNVLRAPELQPVLAAILGGQAIANEVAVHRLTGAGLVRRRGDRVVPRCNLYAQYFKGKV